MRRKFDLHADIFLSQLPEMMSDIRTLANS